MEPIGRFYSMGEVVRETGIPAATLRAWERRYGVPRPGRSSGRQRLYSEQEVALVRWLLVRQQEGTSISRAIAVWKQLAARGEDPTAASAGSSATVQAGGRTLDEMRTSWVAACAQFNRHLAQSVLSQAFAVYPVEEVCMRLLLDGLAEIGERWYAGSLSVQQEHFASAIAAHQVERLIAASPAPWRGERILLACAPEEQHTFPLLLLALLLRGRGWEVVYLGAGVPADRLEGAVREARPSLAVLAAQTLPTAASMVDMARALYSLNVAVGYGGAVFCRHPSLRARVPGHFLGEGLGDAPVAIERLISTRAPSPPVAGPDVEHLAALDWYLSRRAAVEARLGEDLDRREFPPSLAAEATRATESHIEAALRIGDTALLGDGVSWLQLSFLYHKDPLETARRFLAGYQRAAETQGERAGRVLLRWLEGAAGNSR